MIYDLGGDTPMLEEGVWVAPGAHVIGKVILRARASVWFCTTIRGDNEPVEIGAGTNLQENCVLHTDMGYPLTVGRDCTIGHKAMLHGCTIGDESLIGMGATVLNGARIGTHCLIGAGALVTEGKEIPDRSLVLGAPARVVRELDAEAIQALKASALHYQEAAARFARGLTEIAP